MPLFSFGKLIREENPGISTALTKREPEHSFKDLVKRAVHEQSQIKLNSTATQEQDDTEVAQPQIETIEVAPQTLPAVPQPEQIVPETKELRKTQPQLITEVPKDIEGTDNLGVYFLNTFLHEFEDVLSAGKALDKLENRKAEINTEGNSQDLKHLTEKQVRDNIATQLSTLLTIEDPNENTLKNVLDSYDEYLKEFEKKYSQKSSKLLNEKNQIIIRIGQKREEIKKLMLALGGSEIFNSIKEVIIKCKKIRSETLKSGESLSDAIRNDVTLAVNTFIEGDLHGAQLLAEQGNIVGILMRMFAPPQI